MAEPKADGVSSNPIVEVELPKFFKGNVMSVTVTDNEGDSDTYQIHKTTLQQKSPYFKALPNFQEGEESHVRLDNMNVKAFENLVYWMYKGQLDPELNTDRVTLIHTWAAADRLMMTRCKNEAMDALRHACINDFTDPTYLAIVEELGYSEDCLLSEFLTDQIACDCCIIDLPTMGDEFRRALRGTPHDYVIGTLMKHIAKNRDNENRKSKGLKVVDAASEVGCWYHQHDLLGEKCYLKVEE